MNSRLKRNMVAIVFTAAVSMVTIPLANAAPDGFFASSSQYHLAKAAPGTILRSRVLPFHVAGMASPVRAVQIIYRSTDAQGRAIQNATSVLEPPSGVDPRRAVVYESAYDSLNPADGPSRVVAGLPSPGASANTGEAAAIGALLAQGYSVIEPDTEGPNAVFAAGPEYGTTTLDAIRAATRSPLTGLNGRTKVGLLGYSGGAIGANWAASLAANYAPDVDRNLVGVAEGGLLVNPARNLQYVSGSSRWAGVTGMAIVGIGRAYDIDLTPYVNAYGRTLVAKMQTAPIANVLGKYPGLTWQQLVRPQYANPLTVPPYVAAIRRINLGRAATPTVPMFIAQGTGGLTQGTPNNKPGIGPGDGVMIAGDVRALARQYCATGNTHIVYTEYPQLDHIQGAIAWFTPAMIWMKQRFDQYPAPTNCSTIQPGNRLVPEL